MVDPVRVVPRWVPAAVGAVGATLGLATTVLAAAGGTRVLPSLGNGALPFAIAFAAVGLLLAVKRPQNAIGPLFMAAGLLFFGQALIDAYSDDVYKAGVDLPLASWVANPTQWIFAPALMVGIILPALRFPDGGLTRRGRWLSRSGWMAIVMMTLAFVTQPGRLESYPVTNPFGVTALRGVDSAVEALWLLVYLTVIVGAVGTVVGRYRRAHAVLRAQMRWFLYGVAVVVVGQLVAIVFTFVSDDGGPALATLVAIPVCMSVAILRYRLYDIDRVVSRTVSYLVITGVLVGTYVGVVALTTDALPFSSSVGVAASTLAAAALFQPVRRRVQAAVDRRFNRVRYDAARTVDAFSARLREEVDLATVRADLLQVVGRTTQPAHASLWVAP